MREPNNNALAQQMRTVRIGETSQAFAVHDLMRFAFFRTRYSALWRRYQESQDQEGHTDFEDDADTASTSAVGAISSMWMNRLECLER